MTIRAIIFDFDGVIIDTETPDFETWRELYQEHGLDLTPDLWVRRVGAAADNLHFDPAHYYQQVSGSMLQADALVRQRQRYLDRCETLPLLPGVLELIHYARDHQLKLAIASNSYREWVEKYANLVGVRSYFECVCTLSDVEHGKPAPDLYLCAAACLGVPVEECFAIEDSPTGMQAALSAGIRVVGVLNPLTAPLSRPDGVSLILNALSEIEPGTLIQQF